MPGATRARPRPAGSRSRACQLLPQLILAGADGALEARTDSTPLIRDLETLHPGRSVIPPDRALAFVDALLEDYADEWLTKAMFHYRWAFAADVANAAAILPRWFRTDQPESEAVAAGKMFAERQVGRLAVVGSNPATAPRHRSELSTPAAAARRAPDALALRLRRSPRVVRLRHLRPADAAGRLRSDAGGDRAPAKRRASWRGSTWWRTSPAWSRTERDWMPRDAVPDTLRALLAEVGRVYVPFLLANAARPGTRRRARRMRHRRPRRGCSAPSRIRAKCLRWLREGYGALGRRRRAQPSTRCSPERAANASSPSETAPDQRGGHDDKTLRHSCWSLLAARPRRMAGLRLPEAAWARAAVADHGSDPSAARGDLGAGSERAVGADRPTPAEHRGDRRRRPRLQRPDLGWRRRRRRRGADAAHRLDRARRRSALGGLRGQRHLRAVARGHPDRALPDPLRLRVHAGAEDLHASGRQHDARPARRAARADLPRRARERDVPSLDQEGRAAERDHARRAAARAAATARSASASGTSARRRRCAPRRRASTSTSASTPAARCTWTPDDPRRGRTRCRSSTRSTSSCGPTCRSPCARTAANAFAPATYMTDYLGNEAVEGDRGEPQSALLPLSRAQRAAHAAAGAALGLRRAGATSQNHRAARLRGDDPRARSRPSAACSRRCRRTGSKTTPWCSSPATTAAPTTSACPTSTGPIAAGR